MRSSCVCGWLSVRTGLCIESGAGPPAQPGVLRGRRSLVIRMLIADCERLAFEHELADGTFVFGDGSDSQVQGVHLLFVASFR